MSFRWLSLSIVFAVQAAQALDFAEPRHCAREPKTFMLQNQGLAFDSIEYTGTQVILRSSVDAGDLVFNCAPGDHAPNARGWSKTITSRNHYSYAVENEHPRQTAVKIMTFDKHFGPGIKIENLNDENKYFNISCGPSGIRIQRGFDQIFGPEGPLPFSSRNTSSAASCNNTFVLNSTSQKLMITNARRSEPAAIQIGTRQ